MTEHTTTKALVIQDASGNHYLPTDDMLDRARINDEQRDTVLEDGDTRGFTIVLEEFHRRPPFQVVGLVTLPLPARPFEPNRQDLAPCI